MADDQIPDDLQNKIRSDFYELYIKHKKQFGSVDIDKIFEKFMEPKKELAEKYGVNLDDDEWYVKAKDDLDVSRFADTIRKKYSELRGRPKTRSASLHDAIMLFRVKELRDQEGKNVLFLSTDRSLSGTVPIGARYKNLSINLSAVLQWMSPLADVGLEGQDFTYVFSELVKYRLLPQERFFDLEDFLIFHELHMVCRELPAQDVEECISYLKKNVSGLDPSNPEDREKIAYEVSKFFADPGRKYKQAVSKLESAMEAQKYKYEEKLGNIRKQVEEIAKKHEEEKKVLQSEHEKSMAQNREQIDGVQEKLAGR